MRPEFPPELELDGLLQIVTSVRPVPCTMLRLEVPCGNDADTIHLYKHTDGSVQVLAICDMCKDEIYAQQREWRY